MSKSLKLFLGFDIAGLLIKSKGDDFDAMKYRLDAWRSGCTNIVGQRSLDKRGGLLVEDTVLEWYKKLSISLKNASYDNSHTL